MAKSTHSSEDWNASMAKCEAISKLIPMLADSIKHIRQLDRHFEHNKSLTMAWQMFTPLCSVKRLKSTEEKMQYVDNYREHLVQGMEQLTHFFNELNKEMQHVHINEDQQNEFGRLSANIYKTQESIVHIATH